MTRCERRRREFGLTQKQLAVRSGLHQTSISQIEARRFAPSADQLERLAAALGIEVPATLLDEVEPPEAPRLTPGAELRGVTR